MAPRRCPRRAIAAGTSSPSSRGRLPLSSVSLSGGCTSSGKVSSLSADTGCFSAANVEACEARLIEPLLSMTRESHHVPVLERFAAGAPAPQTLDAVARMAHRLGTKKGSALFKFRKQTVGPDFGINKRVMGRSQMSVRGLEKARGERSLVTMAWNIKRLHVLRAACGVRRATCDVRRAA